MDGWPVREGNVSKTNQDYKGQPSLSLGHFHFKTKHELFGLFIRTGTWSQAKVKSLRICPSDPTQCQGCGTCVHLETCIDGDGGVGGRP